MQGGRDDGIVALDWIVLMQVYVLFKLLHGVIAGFTRSGYIYGIIQRVTVYSDNSLVKVI